MENIYYSTIKMLLLVMLFASGIILLYRYGGKLKSKPSSKGYGLQRAETIHLGYRKFVSVVQVRDRILVIGVGDKEISLLTQWKNEDRES